MKPIDMAIETTTHGARCRWCRHENRNYWICTRNKEFVGQEYCRAIDLKRCPFKDKKQG